MAKEYKVRSFRIEDEVWEAVRASEFSANQLLRTVLQFSFENLRELVEEEVQRPVKSDEVFGDREVRIVHATVTKAGSPTFRPHMLHSGTRPIEGCEECAKLRAAV